MRTPVATVVVAMAVVTSGTSAAAAADTVDIFLRGATVAIAEDGVGEATLTVGNVGPASTSGPVSVKLVSPFFVIVDRGRPLPRGCEFILANEDPAIPEVLECRLSAGIEPGATRSVTLGLRLLPGGPRTPLISAAIATPDAGSTDVETGMGNNLAGFTVVRVPSASESGAHAGRNTVNTFLANDVPPILAGAAVRRRSRWGTPGRTRRAAQRGWSMSHHSL